MLAKAGYLLATPEYRHAPLGGEMLQSSVAMYRRLLDRHKRSSANVGGQAGEKDLAKPV